jgi:hypothetical protein
MVTEKRWSPARFHDYLNGFLPRFDRWASARLKPLQERALVKPAAVERCLRGVGLVKSGLQMLWGIQGASLQGLEQGLSHFQGGHSCIEAGVLEDDEWQRRWSRGDQDSHGDDGGCEILVLPPRGPKGPLQAGAAKEFPVEDFGL